MNHFTGCSPTKDNNYIKYYNKDFNLLNYIIFYWDRVNIFVTSLITHLFTMHTLGTWHSGCNLIIKPWKLEEKISKTKLPFITKEQVGTKLEDGGSFKGWLHVACRGLYLMVWTSVLY